MIAVTLAVAAFVALTYLRRSLPTSTIARAIASARAQIGKPYKWGAVGPDSFDCSGLMWFAWKQAGVSFARLTANELFNRLRRVSRADLQPGDMVFFGTAGNLHHVGLYVGNGQMVHAPNSKSTVKESPIASMSDFYAGGRLRAT
jgi:hypothetical protein